MKTWLLALAICTLGVQVGAWAQSDQAGLRPQGAFFPAVPAAADQPNLSPATADQPGPTPAETPTVAWTAERNVGPSDMISCQADAITSGQPFHLEVDADDPGKLQIGLPHMKSPGSSTLHFAFDNGVAVDVPADFENSAANAFIDASNMKAFIHGFTAANTMTISIAGSSLPPSSYSLAGTTAAITSLGMCAKDASIYLPPPFVIPNVAPPQPATVSAPAPTVAPSATDDTAPQPTTNEAGSPPAVASSPPPPAAQIEPGMVIQALNCELTEMGPEIQGLITNDTGDSVQIVQLVFVFRSASGGFISTDNTFADYRPILPNQTSPFTDIGGKNPEISIVEASVTDMDGSTIPVTGQLTAACQGSPNS